jgi:hypothetical protein
VPGQEVSVSLEVHPPVDTLSYAIEDHVPDGWILVSAAAGGVFDKATSQVKFGPFLDDRVRALTYTLRVPAGDMSARKFSGVFSSNGRDRPIAGDSNIQAAGLSSGLVAYYPFNGNANDESGHGNDGIILGAMPSADRFGRSNSAFAFNELALSAITVPNPKIPVGTSARTFSFWCNIDLLDTTPFRSEYLLGYGDQYCTIHGHSFGITLNNSKNFNMSACFNDYSTFGLPIFDSNWHMVTLTLVTNVLWGYLDGKKFNWTSFPPPGSKLNTDSSDLYIGEFANQYFDGLLDDLRIYDRALSDTEIQQLYQIESQPPSEVIVDVNADGLPDILFEDGTGQVGYWSMQGGDMMTAGAFIPATTGDSAWKLVGSGDFDGDQNLDLVFQYRDGTLATWLMDKTSMRVPAYFGPTRTYWSSGPDWHLVGVRDIDGDHKPDLVFQHSDGWLAAWLMDGTNLITAKELNPRHPGDKGWEVVGTGDFYGTGKWDLAFQHDDGTLAIWEMDGLNMVTPHILNPSYPGSHWRVVGVADLDGDGKSDLLLEYTVDHSFGVWFMDGYNLRKPMMLDPQFPGGSWKIVGPR